MSDSVGSQRTRNLIIGAAIAILLVILIVAGLRGREEAGDGPLATGAASSGTDLTPSTDPGGTDASGVDVDPPTGSDPGIDPVLARRWFELVGSQPRWPDDLSSPGDCQEVERALEDVCRALDARPGMDELADGSDVYAIVIEVSEKLAARPPESGSELKSHGRMVANVYHLFRVLGRERMTLLRDILLEHEDLAEPAALALHRWLVSREACSGNSSTPIRLEPLYEYSTYLFTTMGGQAYLRRRPARTEALACFWALQVLDLAIEQGHNPHGVDPRPEIGRCRGLIEAQQFVFRDRYVEQLDRIGSRWGRGGPGR